MKVLIAEDDLVSRRILESTLAKWGYDVVVCSNGAEAWQALQNEGAPQLAILDWMMPAMAGVEICRQVRKQPKGPYVYILLLTAKSRKEEIIEGMEAGADDYLAKPFDIQELKVRLHAGKRILDLQAELIAAQEALRFRATHDPLTGVWNRVAILDMLGRELARSMRERKPLGIVMADLDHFKSINDAYGHLAGDAVLREAADRMVISMRPFDGIGRYGGEEFLVVLPGCNASCARIVAERLRASIAGESMAVSDQTISVTASLGVASSDETQEPNPDWLIQAADAALYRAKRAGRNRVEIATTEGVFH